MGNVGLRRQVHRKCKIYLSFYVIFMSLSQELQSLYALPLFHDGGLLNTKVLICVDVGGACSTGAMFHTQPYIFFKEFKCSMASGTLHRRSAMEGPCQGVQEGQ